MRCLVFALVLGLGASAMAENDGAIGETSTGTSNISLIIPERIEIQKNGGVESNTENIYNLEKEILVDKGIEIIMVVPE